MNKYQKWVVGLWSSSIVMIFVAIFVKDNAPAFFGIMASVGALNVGVLGAVIMWELADRRKS